MSYMTDEDRLFYEDATLENLDEMMAAYGRRLGRRPQDWTEDDFLAFIELDAFTCPGRDHNEVYEIFTEMMIRTGHRHTLEKGQFLLCRGHLHLHAEINCQTVPLTPPIPTPRPAKRSSRRQ